MEKYKSGMSSMNKKCSSNVQNNDKNDDFYIDSSLDQIPDIELEFKGESAEAKKELKR